MVLTMYSPAGPQAWSMAFMPAVAFFMVSGAPSDIGAFPSLLLFFDI